MVETAFRESAGAPDRDLVMKSKSSRNTELGIQHF